MYVYEEALHDQDKVLIAGVDEVGRGPLAGPLVAAAVILPQFTRIKGLNDSKQLSEKKRETLYHQIMKEAVSVAIAIIEPAEVDTLNVYQASKKAMIDAVRSLQVKPEHVLIDAMVIKELDIPSTSIIKGDTLSASIAAASIVAKVTRDNLMVMYDTMYPDYGFKKHKGYPTKSHKKALELHGVTPIHRTTFGPVRKLNVKQLKFDL